MLTETLNLKIRLQTQNKLLIKHLAIIFTMQCYKTYFMGHHFNNKEGKQKKSYDNFKSAKLDCDKYNSKIENLGKIMRVTYLCKICDKVHITNDYHKKIINFNVQEKAKKSIEKLLSNSLLINRIDI